MVKTIEWTSDGVRMIDQRKLPTVEEYPVFKTYREVADAIRDMVIRGAPAIGVAAAMGVTRAAITNGKRLRVLADETRPFLQGARLTAWELSKDDIDVRVISDNMAGTFMRQGLVDAVIVGADRIATNGDVANKIGTYSVAVLAKQHEIPFYVAAPFSTVDMTISDGSHIPIEQRDPAEVTHIGGVRMVPEGVPVFNPAFDVTPHEFVTAIITDRGVANPPYLESLARLKDERSECKPDAKRKRDSAQPHD